MNADTLASAKALLELLVAFPTVSDRSNLELIAFVERYFQDLGVETRTLPNASGDKAALVATALPGLTTPDQVKFVFLHPAMWDLVVWVLPNPDGAFADANPNVKPSTPKTPAM